MGEEWGNKKNKEEEEEDDDDERRMNECVLQLGWMLQTFLLWISVVVVVCCCDEEWLLCECVLCVQWWWWRRSTERERERERWSVCRRESTLCVSSWTNHLPFDNKWLNNTTTLLLLLRLLCYLFFFFLISSLLLPISPLLLYLFLFDFATFPWLSFFATQRNNTFKKNTSQSKPQANAKAQNAKV